MDIRTVRDGRQSGILVDKDGRGTFDHDRIFGNAGDAIDIDAASKADVVLRNNRVE